MRGDGGDGTNFLLQNCRMQGGAHRWRAPGMCALETLAMLLQRWRRLRRSPACHMILGQLSNALAHFILTTWPPRLMAAAHLRMSDQVKPIRKFTRRGYRLRTLPRLTGAHIGSFTANPVGNLADTVCTRNRLAVDHGCSRLQRDIRCSSRACRMGDFPAGRLAACHATLRAMPAGDPTARWHVLG